jgi:hypothetical protein
VYPRRHPIAGSSRTECLVRRRRGSCCHAVCSCGSVVAKVSALLQRKSLLLGGSDVGTAMAALLRAFYGVVERPTLAGVMGRACRLKIAARCQEHQNAGRTSSHHSSRNKNRTCCSSPLIFLSTRKRGEYSILDRKTVLVLYALQQRNPTYYRDRS